MFDRSLLDPRLVPETVGSINMIQHLQKAQGAVESHMDLQQNMVARGMPMQNGETMVPNLVAGNQYLDPGHLQK